MTVGKTITIIVLVLAIAASLSFAQDKKDRILQEIPSSLEAMFACAFKSNPDILVAEADLLQAQAKLKQVRLKISRALIEASLHRSLSINAVEIARREYERRESLVKRGQLQGESLAAERQALAGAEAAVTESEVMIRAIIGLDPAAAKTPESFDEMLTLALRSNGDIALSEADLVRMDARSNQVRLRVAEEVTIAHQMRRVNQNAVEIATNFLQKRRQMAKDNLLSKDEELVAFQKLIEAETELIRTEARIRYLLGLGDIAPPAK